MTFSGLWLALAYIVRRVFKHDPIEFGRACCRASVFVVSSGLTASARQNWLDEATDYVESDIWESLKRTDPDSIGASLIWHALSILVNGWSERTYYKESAEILGQSAPNSESLLISIVQMIQEMRDVQRRAWRNLAGNAVVSVALVSMSVAWINIDGVSPLLLAGALMGITGISITAWHSVRLRRLGTELREAVHKARESGVVVPD